MNIVIAGDYKGKAVVRATGKCCIATGFFKTLVLTKDIVETYEVVTDEHRKSAASGISKGLIGGALLGPVGMIGGAMSAKSKGTYQVVIQFKDGKKSLIQINDKIYKILVRSLF